MMDRNVRFAVIVPAAGRGSRIGGNLPKQYAEILGEPVLRHTVRRFASMEECHEVLVAIDEAWKRQAEEAVAGLPNVRLVPGGGERQHSIWKALAEIDAGHELLLVHDAARPAVSVPLIHRVARAAWKEGAAIPALPLSETIKRVGEEGRIVETVPRDGLYAAQTPQGFRADLLRHAYDHARHTGFVGTDDASLVEHLGEPVYVVEGEIGNVKITWEGDFGRAEETLKRIMNEEL